MIKKIRNSVEKRENMCTVGGNINWHATIKKQYELSSKKIKIELPYSPTIPLISI